MGIWVFDKLRGAAVLRDPKEAELFKTEQADEGEYAGTDALVREVIQNSIDAQAGSEPVRVRLSVHEAADAPAADRLKHYFGRLRRPLNARGVAFTAQGIPEQPCRFLVCEDFGTRGLEGNPELFGSAPVGRDTREDLYWFWRNIGRSGKTGDDLGRWGLGKTVYRAASRAASMFGLTVRHSDRRTLLIGQTVLSIHWDEGEEYQPEGYWCASQNDKGVPLPIEDAAELAQFGRDWKLTRASEPGLSVVAPYVPLELQADRLLQAVAVHFFARILRNELVVEVMGSNLGCVRLDCESLAETCARIRWNGPKRTKRHMPPPIEFAQRCLQSAPTVQTEVLGTAKLPDLDTAAFSADDLVAQRAAFAAGNLVSVRVRLSLPKVTGAAVTGELDVHIQRDPQLAAYDTYYVREGMTITKLNSSAGRKGVRGLVFVEPGPLAELLGDTEGPAHEDWQTSADRPNLKWKTWKGRVSFVRRIVDTLAEVMTPPATQPDFNLLADFFSIERTHGPQKQPRAGDEEPKEPEFDPIVSTPKWFQVVERSGGFTLSRNCKVTLPASPALRLSIAYDIPQGDPLRKWSPLDFQISTGNGGLRPTGEGLRARRVQGNVVTLDVEKEQFNFTMGGFDPYRDLFVRVDDISAHPDEEWEA